MHSRQSVPGTHCFMTVSHCGLKRRSHPHRQPLIRDESWSAPPVMLFVHTGALSYGIHESHAPPVCTRRSFRCSFDSDSRCDDPLWSDFTYPLPAASRCMQPTGIGATNSASSASSTGATSAHPCQPHSEPGGDHHIVLPECHLHVRGDIVSLQSSSTSTRACSGTVGTSCASWMWRL